MTASTFLQRAGLTLLAVFAALQLVPYGRAHENPGARVEPAWANPRTRTLTARACFDCHSNEVRWPWYSFVAPASWLVTHDVNEARTRLNFSAWNAPHETDELLEQVQSGKMPPGTYLFLHPDARLGDAERLQLVEGLRPLASTE